MSTCAAAALGLETIASRLPSESKLFMVFPSLIATTATARFAPDVTARICSTPAASNRAEPVASGLGAIAMQQSASATRRTMHVDGSNGSDVLLVTVMSTDCVATAGSCGTGIAPRGVAPIFWNSLILRVGIVWKILVLEIGKS